MPGGILPVPPCPELSLFLLASVATRAVTDRHPATEPYFYFCFYIFFFFDGNEIGFEKYGFENGIGICGHTETNKYGRRAGKLN
jgi:hypothetical protein